MTGTEEYDVFLSHNSRDKPFVRKVATCLRAAGLRVFLDEDELRPGHFWQEALEVAIDKSKTCAVFFSDEKMGAVHEPEARLAFSKQLRSKDGFVTIPVLIPGKKSATDRDLPAFLRELTWVQFQADPSDDRDALAKLIWGITGTKQALNLPQTGLPTERQQTGTPTGSVVPKSSAFLQSHARFWRVLIEGFLSDDDRAGHQNLVHNLRQRIADLKLEHYVWPQLFWEDPQERDDKGQPKRWAVDGDEHEAAMTVWRELLAQQKNIILHDDAGMGKTAFTWKLLGLLLKRVNTLPELNGRTPLIVRLEGKWPKQKNDEPLSIAEMLYQEVERTLLLQEKTYSEPSLRDVIKTALAQDTVILVMDAFDQCTPKDREHIAKLLKSDTSSETDNGHAACCRWIVTGRAYALRENLQDNLLDNVKHLRLGGLAPEQQDQYFHDLEEDDRFQSSGIKPLDWICEDRKSLGESLSIPFHLRQIRRLLESQGAETKKIKSASDLHRMVAEKSLQRAIIAELEQLRRDKSNRELFYPPERRDQLDVLFHVSGLLAFQLMLEERFNDAGIANSHDNKSNVRKFMERVKKRFLDNAPSIDWGFECDNWEPVWNWAIAMLERIEFSHRGDIDNFNRGCRSFRDRKTMEWYAAHYLMNYATKDDLRTPSAVVDVNGQESERSARDFAFNQDWLNDCWRLAINMPRDAINKEVAGRSLELLFERPLASDLNPQRPCEHMYLAWERWLEPREAGVKVLPGAQEVIERFRSEYATLLAANDPSAKEIAEGFIAIPLGTFQMGSPEEESGRYDNETRHEVTLTRQFSLHRFAVTNAQYELFDSSHGSRRSKYSPGADHPAVNVSWYEAWCFSRWVGLAGGECRLPTEAEWEYACRAGSPGAYCFGDDESQLGEYAWYGENSGVQTHPVGGKKSNAWGLHDMHGNVWEWCQDWYDDYDPTQTSDPVGPSKGSNRVFRGGSWTYAAAYCRSAFRGGNDPTVRWLGLGFRLALSPLEPS